MQRILTSFDVELPTIAATQQLVHDDDEEEEQDGIHTSKRKPLPSSSSLSLKSDEKKILRNESILPELPAEASSTQIDSSVEAASAAAACISSNKHKRPSHTSSKNEDRVYVHRTDSGEALFVAVFDGHGGNAQCSQFLSENLHAMYEIELTSCLNEMRVEDESLTSVTPVVVLRSLERSFIRTDEEFYRLVHEKANSAGLRDAKSKMCRCNFYYEDPCVCMSPPISANEGSTATVVVVSKDHFVVANVGDSDAYVVRRNEQEYPVSSSYKKEEQQHDEDGDEKDSFLFQDKALLPRSRPSDNGFQGRSLKRVKSSCDETEENGVNNNNSGQAYTNQPKETHHSSSSHAYFSLEQLTECDNPSRHHIDYQRISAVAKSRHERPLPNGFTRPASVRFSTQNGLLESPNNVRFNYVCMPGARSLNMARAFGNLGAKAFTEEGRFLENESGIIARPHMKVVERSSDMCALVLGSDGLWDNLNANEIGDALSRIFPTNNEYDRTVSDDTLIFGEPGVNKTNSKSTHHAAAKNLLTRALSTMRKPDDISVVVVALSNTT